MRTRNLERLDYSGSQYDDYDGYKTTAGQSIYSTATGQSANRMSGHVTSSRSKYDYDYGGCMDDNICDDTCTMYDDGQWEMNSCSGVGRRTTSSTTSKLLPKVPMKHSMSVIDSIAGASLLPNTTLVSSTTTATVSASTTKRSRLLPQPMVKSSTSRMLPKMPPVTNTARHRAPMIRRNDSEYSDHDSMYSAYSYRPGAVSAIQFNEDYNYAYQSTDSLNTTAQSVLSEYGSGGVGERRSKMSAISSAIPIASGTLKSTSSSTAAAAATTSSRYHAYGSRTQPSSFDQVSSLVSSHCPIVEVE